MYHKIDNIRSDIIYEQNSRSRHSYECMLPPFIIDKIREREEKRQRDEAERPAVRIPLDDDFGMPLPDPSHITPEEEDANRGVVIIQLMEQYL